jgi:hypothetical protein
VNHAQLGVNATPIDPAQQCSTVVDQGVLVPGFVGDAEHAGRLVNDDHIPVVRHDRAVSQPTRMEFGCT